MNVTAEIDARAERIASLIEKRLGVRRGRGLEAKLRGAGRRLPRGVRRHAETIVAAQRLAAHPRLARQADPRALDEACRACEKWLQTVDPAARRRDRIISFLAANAFNLLVVAGLLLLTLRLTGHL